MILHIHHIILLLLIILLTAMSMSACVIDAHGNNDEHTSIRSYM